MKKTETTTAAKPAARSASATKTRAKRPPSPTAAISKPAAGRKGRQSTSRRKSASPSSTVPPVAAHPSSETVPDPQSICREIMLEAVRGVCDRTGSKSEGFKLASSRAGEGWGKLFRDGNFKGGKAARRATDDLIKAAIKCSRTVQKKVRPRKSAPPDQ
jgi:hypothetical protein